jgi:hypothetical protein
MLFSRYLWKPILRLQQILLTGRKTIRISLRLTKNKSFSTSHKKYGNAFLENPISWIVLRNRLVSREDGSSSSGNRSVKIFREGISSSNAHPCDPDTTDGTCCSNILGWVSLDEKQVSPPSGLNDPSIRETKERSRGDRCRP